MVLLQVVPDLGKVGSVLGVAARTSPAEALLEAEPEGLVDHASDHTAEEGEDRGRDHTITWIQR